MYKKFISVLALFIALQIAAMAEGIDQAWLAKNYTKSEQMVPMRDGARLFTTIYAPRDTDGSHPILITRTPYSCSPYGGDQLHGRLWKSHWSEYVKAGYIIVFQDVRGRYMSEGEFVDIRPFIPNKRGKMVDEASDTYDTVDWLLKNAKGNNGKVGVLGNSYGGFYAVMAALSGHPAILAVNPQAPATDWFMGDDFHHNGAFILNDSFGFYGGFGQPRPKPTTVGRRGPTRHTTDEYTYFLRMGAIRNLTVLMGDSIRFWNQMMAHPNRDSWWDDRDHTRQCKGIKAAMLITAGLFDAEDLYGALATYRAIASQSPKAPLRLALGPWSHGGWNSTNGGTKLGYIRFGSQTSNYYAQQIEIPFFNYYLKGEGTLDMKTPNSIFISGENKWYNLPATALNDATPTPLYLGAHGSLSMSRPTADNSKTGYTSDPAHPVPYMEGTRPRRDKEYMTADQRFAARRPDVATFVTEPLTNDMTLMGPINVDLKVSISTTDADFVVKLIDVFPDDFRYDEKIYGRSDNYPMGGFMMLVRAEVMRGRFRNSFSHPEPFSPGEVTTVAFTLPDVAHTFKRGHRLAMQVQSSWFPLVDRNPQQFVDPYKCSDSDFVPAQISILHQSQNASCIMLPIRQ